MYPTLSREQLLHSLSCHEHETPIGPFLSRFFHKNKDRIPCYDPDQDGQFRSIAPHLRTYVTVALLHLVYSYGNSATAHRTILRDAGHPLEEPRPHHVVIAPCSLGKEHATLVTDTARHLKRVTGAAIVRDSLETHLLPENANVRACELLIRRARRRIVPRPLYVEGRQVHIGVSPVRRPNPRCTVSISVVEGLVRFSYDTSDTWGYSLRILEEPPDVRICAQIVRTVAAHMNMDTHGDSPPLR